MALAWSGSGRCHTGCVEAVVVFDPERTVGPMSVRRLRCRQHVRVRVKFCVRSPLHAGGTHGNGIQRSGN